MYKSASLLRRSCALLVAVAISLAYLCINANASGRPPVKIVKPPVPSQDVLLNNLREEVRRLSVELEIYKNDRYLVEMQYTKKYYEYLAKKADLNLAQFEWQRTASERLLWLVVVVVFSGVAFSGYQLWRASKTNDLPGDSSIEIAVQKVKITSSVVGVIVLAISIIFFYFFLIEVYRVKVVDLTPSETRPLLPNSAAPSSEQVPNTAVQGTLRDKAAQRP